MTTRRGNQEDDLFAELFELVEPARPLTMNTGEDRPEAGAKGVEDQAPAARVDVAPLHAMLCVLATRENLPWAPLADGHQPASPWAGGRS